MNFDPSIAPWRKSSYSAGGQSECIEVAPWRKSSYSAGGQSDCVEVAPWRKSSYSAGGESQCVEVAPLETVVGVRDTKNRAAGYFTVGHTAWTAFTRAAARGGLTG